MDQNMNSNVPQQESKGFSIASMVLGIVSLVLVCIPAGIVAIILGGVSLATKKGGRGMAIAGLVCAIIGIAVYVILTIIGASLLSSMGIY